jgi:hypothetical protein
MYNSIYLVSAPSPEISNGEGFYGFNTHCFKIAKRAMPVVDKYCIAWL